VAPIRVMLAGLLGLGLALVAMTIGPSIASADSTCYTGCATTLPPSVLATQSGQEPQVLAGAADATSGMAFTGADEAGLVVFAAFALAGGGVLVATTRRRRLNS
jgi:hypothetical protein